MTSTEVPELTDSDQTATDRKPSAGDLETPAKLGTFAALRVRNYRLYFTGQVVSNTGTWMQRIAQDWLVLSLTNSPFAVGVTTALQFGPMLFFGVFGGLAADRYSKRRILLITQVVMGLLATTLAVLTLSGHVAVWQIYLIALGLGFATVFDNPARQTFVGEMVPQYLMRNAVSLNTGNFQLARMVGPAVAGLLISAVGVGWAFGLNAISYLAVLGGLLLMRPAELEHLPTAPRGKGQLRAGFRYAAGNPVIFVSIVLVFFIGTFGYNFAIILSAYAKDIFTSGASLYGLLNTVMAAGSLVGAVFAARRTTGRMLLLFGAAGAFGLALVVLGASSWLPLFLVVLFITGLTGVTFNTLCNSTVQLTTDPIFRGRVMSLYFLVFMGGTPLGSLVVGAIVDRWGAPAGLVVSGIVCVLATAGCAWLFARRSGARLPELSISTARQLRGH